MSSFGGARRAADLRPRFIIVRGEKITSLTLRPWVAWTAGVVGLVFGVLYLAATGYLILRDDMLSSSLAQQIELRRTYESRIAALRSDIDRLNSRNLLAQESMDAELRRLRDRQAALDARQDVIVGLSQAAHGAGIEPEDIPQRNQEDARLNLRPGRSAGHGIGTALEAMEETAVRLAERQDDYLRAVGSLAAQKAQEIASALDQLGVDLSAVDRTVTASVGGPFVAAEGHPGTDEFRVMVAAVAEDLASYEHASTVAASVPLRAPLAKPRVSSKFGKRIDPFLRKPAWHGGLDYKAPSGRTVVATAPGVVTSAGYAGGYGKLVEIDHGNGLRTRYAHLKRITVRKGQQIAAGERIGAVGSTGRSTGPHLHYEIRRKGRPIDPAPFIRAGRRIAALLEPGH